MDLSKAFDAVYHGILLKKLEAYGARVNVHQLLASFSQNRKHFVQIDEKVSEVEDINVEVSKRSVLGLLLFLININDKTDTQDESSPIALFAEDCSILTSLQHNPISEHGKQIHQFRNWLSDNKLTLKLGKTFYLKFGRTQSMRNTVRINEKLLKTERSLKHLGIGFDFDLKFKNHVSYVCKKICILVGFLQHCKYTITRDLKLQFPNYFIKPIIEYGLLVYGSTSESQLRPILRIIYNLPFHASCTHLFTESGIRTVYAMYVGALLK